MATTKNSKKNQGVSLGQRHHLKEWREHRALTQTKLAASIGTTASVISLLEVGKRRLSDRWLARIATVLHVPRGVILDYGPGSDEAQVLEAWSKVPAKEKRQLLLLVRELGDVGMRTELP